MCSYSSGIKGVVSPQVNITSKEAFVTYDPFKASLRDIVRAVRSTSYDVYRKEVILAIMKEIVLMLKFLAKSRVEDVVVTR